MSHRITFLMLFLSLAFGCASLTSQAPLATLQGPGAIYDSAEAAAVDGLGWCARDARRDAAPRLRIGVVRQVPGGYTYDTPGVASWATPKDLDFLLTRDAVAHFRHFSVADEGRRTIGYEHHSRRQRRVVDELDPLHRPSYLLTPSLRVLVYYGLDRKPEEVARLRRTPGGGVLATR